MCSFGFYFFFFKQYTAYEMRISDWSSDVCSSDLQKMIGAGVLGHRKVGEIGVSGLHVAGDAEAPKGQVGFRFEGFDCEATSGVGVVFRSEEHTSELQSLMRISYAVFCLKKKKKKKS